MLTVDSVARVASDKGLVLEKNVTKQDGITYRYTLYDNNEFVEDFFETLAQAWSYIYYYDEAREYENYRTDVEAVEATLD
jgi:hypothetical protein